MIRDQLGQLEIYIDLALTELPKPKKGGRPAASPEIIRQVMDNPEFGAAELCDKHYPELRNRNQKRRQYQHIINILRKQQSHPKASIPQEMKP